MKPYFMEMNYKPNETDTQYRSVSVLKTFNPI